MTRWLHCAALALMVVCALMGCRRDPPLPRSYPAVGNVAYKGGQPLKGGSIQFNTAADPLLRVVAEISENGEFKLHTIKDNAKAEGAPEGDYQVTVTLPRPVHAAGDVVGAHKSLPPVTLERTYKVEAHENTIKIELPIAPP